MSRLNVLFVLLLAGCSAPIEETHFVASWRCGPQIVFDAFQAGDALQLVFPDRRLALQPAASEDGRRYTSETAEFRENNEIAVLTLNGERHECRHDTSVMNAVERGVDYRAVGQEPGWLLEISRGEKIELQYDYGGAFATLPWSAPESGVGEKHFIVESGGERLEVHVVVAPCQDAMSGQPYPDTVTVRYRDDNLERELNGCGRPLPQADTVTP